MAMSFVLLSNVFLQSIMHRNSKGKPVNNERLEFLGDAVLDAVVDSLLCSILQ